MIKKFILLITVLGSINSLYSQNIAKVDYHHFIVKNNHHYQIISDMNTNFDFYSDNSGGNYLRSVSTTSDFNTFHGFIDLPGLIVCKDPTKNKSVYGLVAHTTKPLFHLKQYNIIKLNKDIYISISLENLAEEELYVNIIKLNDKGNEEIVEAIPVIEDKIDYYYKDGAPDDRSIYKILIKSRNSTAYFKTKALAVDNMDASYYKIYPMPAKNTLIVEHIPNNSTYEIINVKGAVVASGELTLFSDKIDISSINTGTYYITFRNEIHEISRKIIVLK